MTSQRPRDPTKGRVDWDRTRLPTFKKQKLTRREGDHVDATRSQSLVMHQLARDAEALLSRLAGVAHARVVASSHGIDAVHIVATDPAAARDLAGHVRSALLAGLATPVLASRIHVRVDDGGTRGEAPSNGGRHRQAPPPSRPAHRVRLLETASATHGPPHRRHAERPGDPAPDAEAPKQTINHTDRPRLVSVDIEKRADRRILCRVAVAHAAHVHSAEAIAVDLPGAAAQAAAQATVRALIDAGIPGLELNGLREVEIAGRDFVIVALRRTDTSRRLRSGSAPIIGSAERSAAEATVVAAHELI